MEEATEPTAQTPTAADPTNSVPLFTQTDVNKFMAEERRKSESKMRQESQSLNQMLSDTRKTLEDFQQSAKLSADEKAQLSATLDEVRGELAAREKYAEFVSKRQIENELSYAARESTVPSVLVEFLRPRARVEGEKNAERARVVIDLPDVDPATGEAITKQYSPIEIIKQMQQDEAFAPLFKTRQVGGIGGTPPSGAARKTDLKTRLQSPEGISQFISDLNTKGINAAISGGQ